MRRMRLVLDVSPDLNTTRDFGIENNFNFFIVVVVVNLDAD